MNSLALLSQLKAITTQTRDRLDALQQIANTIRISGHFRWVGLYEVDYIEKTVRNIVYSGPGAPAYPVFPITNGLTGSAISTRSTVNVGDVSNDARYLTAFGSTQSEIIVPIFDANADRVIGTIDIESDYRDAFDVNMQRVLEQCARQISPLWQK